MNKILYYYMIITIIILVLVPIFYSVITTNKITATDWIYRHTAWISRYLHNDFTPVLEYPPLFHFLMLSFVAIDFPMIYFQIIFSIANLIIILYFTYRLENKDAVLFVGMFLVTSVSYMQISSALMPQAIDLLLFLPAVIFYFKGKYLQTSILLSLLLLNHIAGLIYCSIFFLHDIITKRYKFLKYILLIAIIFSPLYFIYIPYNYFIHPLNGYWDYESEAIWQSQFIVPPYKFFILSGILAWILLPYTIYRLYKQNFYISEKQKFYAIWFVIFIPISFLGFGIWRFISFSIIPLFFFVASMITEDLKEIEKNKYKQRFIKVFE